MSEPERPESMLPLHPDLRDDILGELAEGDLLFRGRDDSWGELGAMVSQRDQRYGHVGVVVRDVSGWRVVSATGNPIASDGRVKSESLDRFIGFSTRLGLYRSSLAEGQIDKSLQIFQYHVEQETAFDRQYDLDSYDKLYCTELIWRALMEVVEYDFIPEKTIWRNREVIALDDLQHSSLLKEVRHLDISDKRLAQTVFYH